jgi:hypothetical protein
MLFDDRERTDASAKRYRETEFEFLDRSADPDVAEVRAAIGREFATYIESEKAELQTRLRSGHRSEFHSACFELLLFGILTRKGYALEAHPDPETGTTKRPDFLVTGPEGDIFYLEAVAPKDMNDLEAGTEARMEEVLDALDTSPHPDFYLDIHQRGEPRSQPPARKLIAHVHAWLDSLDSDAVKASVSAGGEHPGINWGHDGWELEFRALPKHKNRGVLDRLVGFVSYGLDSVDLKGRIREAIRKKGNRYGDLPHPLIVAVNANAFYLKDYDEVDALFGSEAVAFGNGAAELVRENDGAWHDGKKPRTTRVSAAWIFSHLGFYSLHGCRQTLYFNPWAAVPLKAPLDWLPTARLEGGDLVRRDGQSPGEIYGIR